jgi:glycosidase
VSTSALEKLLEALETCEMAPPPVYKVPGIWIDGKTPAAQTVNPFDFYAERLRGILKSSPHDVIQGPGGGDWSARAIVYNLLPRVTGAFDHDDDGGIELETMGGWRETGTLLKGIALLPYIRNLGCNTVHMLPITRVGQFGKKGNLGSPYGIRDPYAIDANLAEPVLNLPADVFLQAFVEAAHHMGLRVIAEFVLRTGSRDSDLIKQHPDWFYWIKADIEDREPGSTDPDAYGNPIFEEETLKEIKQKVEDDDFTDLPEPPDSYQEMFTPPPEPETVTFSEERGYIGVLEDGTEVRIPGAFADWPPDDNQPPWTDVTYLRMYKHPEGKFNYIAYNTIRMYDEELAKPEYRNEPLWDSVAGVIPHWQNTFGIDGVMIDMGHALPPLLKERIVKSARAINPDFAFWDENFTVKKESRTEGYNAVMGFVPFDFWRPHKLRDLLDWMSEERVPIPFFITPENHNTPRAADRPGGFIFSLYSVALGSLLPGLVFISSGFELIESQPINTGLEFTDEMIARYPTDELPLFSAYAFDWTREDNLIESVTYALSIRHKYADLLANPDPATMRWFETANEHIFVLVREDGDRRIVAVINSDMTNGHGAEVIFSDETYTLPAIWGVDAPMTSQHKNSFHVHLGPGHLLILEGDELPPATTYAKRHHVKQSPEEKGKGSDD